MNKVSAKIQIDLAAIDDDRSILDGAFVFDHNSQPIEIELDLTGASAATLNKLMQGGMHLLDGAAVSATLEDAREMDATIGMVSGVCPTHMGSVTVTGKLANASIRDPSMLNAVTASWQYKLTNIKLNLGDEKSLYPLPQGADPNKTPRGWTLNKLRFVMGGREWVLTDDFMNKWRKDDAPDAALPLVTATLTTTAQAADTEEAVSEIAGDIELLLTLALGRDVQSVSRSRIDNQGNTIETLHRSVVVHPFNQAGHPVVDNWTPGTLNPFLEAASNIVAADRKWWRRTLKFYFSVQINKYIEVKSILLNILGNRIAERLAHEDGSSEIDPNLSSRLKDKAIKEALHQVLSQLSPKWDDARTALVIATITNWNAVPSFAESIQRTCRQMRIPEPTKKFLRTRNKLIHVGELEPPDGDISAYWVELEWLVLATILRLLGYSGEMYHMKLGGHPAPLEDQLVPLSPDRIEAIKEECR